MIQPRPPRQTKLNAGELIHITTGEYSSYGVTGIFRVLKDFETNVAIDDFERQHKAPDWDTELFESFLAWCGRNGLIEAIDSREWHLGDYGRFDSNINGEVGK